jgi:EAL domain-containing protein (putative c-di-GMP-specific phosphodiesterase class I)
MAGSAAASTEWAAALQQIFDEPWRVRPAFQPILHLERRAVWGFQVLARFISPLRATPPEWLAAAADAGVHRALEVRLLDAGLQALHTVPERARLLLPMSADTLLADGVQRTLARHVRSLPQVVLDVTDGGEDVALGDLIDAAAPVRRDGAQLAVTAGASPGGLDGLPRLRPHVLKVGPDYVAGLDDGASRAVVEGLVALVAALGGRVLAIGVEQREQVDALAAAGVALGQGFGLGRPVPSMADSVTRAGASMLSG